MENSRKEILQHHYCMIIDLSITHSLHSWEECWWGDLFYRPHTALLAKFSLVHLSVRLSRSRSFPSPSFFSSQYQRNSVCDPRADKMAACQSGDIISSHMTSKSASIKLKQTTTPAFQNRFGLPDLYMLSRNPKEKAIPSHPSQKPSRQDLLSSCKGWELPKRLRPSN